MRSCKGNTLGKMGKKVFSLLLGLSLLILSSVPALAAAWPSTELTAQAGIVMDADTGTILFEKNGTEQLYPASITKILTALVVLKHADPKDMVTFSHDAVYNVDKGSSNAQIEEGDVLSVEDCLYALLLKSANEAANALAEHIAGSRAEFAELMNQEAAALGCTGSHFSNPSGLTSEDHYTTARDMGLIAVEAFHNKEFMKIEESRSHKLPSTKRVPEGLTIYMEHKMLLKNSPYYDKRAIAGKTGYTLASGNTLVTIAESEGRHLVTVVLGDKNPAHYTDTKALLDLGFQQTENLELTDSFFDFSAIRDRLVTDTIVDGEVESSALHVKGERIATVPLGTSESELSYQLNYNLGSEAPNQSVAKIEYLLGEQRVGESYITKDQSIKLMLEEAPTSTKVAAAAAVTVSGFTILAVVGFLLFGGGAAIGVKNVHDERKLNRKMQERRRQRLEELHISEEEFREMVERNKKRR